MLRIISSALLAALCASPVQAAIPPMPGLTSGLSMTGNGMIHAEIAVQNNIVNAILRDGPSGNASSSDRLVAMSANQAAGPFESPYDVLNNQPFNAQIGWLEDQSIGFKPIDIPIDATIAIELIAVSGPGIVSIYEGGNGNQLMTTGHTMNPIQGTGGSPAAWLWDDDFLMQHNWVAFSAPGDYDLTFSIFVADLLGNPLTGYTADDITFAYTVLPEPSTAFITLATLSLVTRRGGRP
ncbi:MAG: hypothetical protein RIG82_00685 [Phycisphaeraceae bacterium]